MASSYPEPGSTYSGPLTEALTRHAVETTISFPFRFDSDGYVAVATGRGNILRQEMLTLILTYLGERVMMPTYGSNLAAHLWDSNEPRVINVVLDQIKDLVGNNFPNVVLQHVVGVPGGEVGEEMRIQLDYTYENDPYFLTVNFSDAFPKDS